MNVNLNGHTVRTGIPNVYYINAPCILSGIYGYIVLLVDCTNAPISVYLSPAANNSDCFVIKKIDSTANVLTITPDGVETIDGSSSVTISIQHTSLTLVTDGSNWNII
jgi:hypothetical protein